MTVTRAEKKLLKQAAKIIARELEALNPVSLPLFGKFYLSRIMVYAGQHPMAEDGWDSDQLRPRYVAHFRSYGCLKEKLRVVAMSEWRAAHAHLHSKVVKRPWVGAPASGLLTIDDDA